MVVLRAEAIVQFILIYTAARGNPLVLYVALYI